MSNNQRRGGNKRPQGNSQRPPRQPKPAPKPKVVVPKAPPESTLVIGNSLKTGAKYAAGTLALAGGYAAYRHYKDKQ